MSRYLVLKFEHDDEFGMFPDDLEIMLFKHSKLPYKIEVVGEGVMKPFTDLFGSPEFKVVPIGSAGDPSVRK